MKIMSNNIKVLSIIMISLAIFSIINLRNTKTSKRRNSNKKNLKNIDLEHFEKDEFIQNYNQDINYLENKKADTLGHTNIDYNCIC